MSPGKLLSSGLEAVPGGLLKGSTDRVIIDLPTSTIPQYHQKLVGVRCALSPSIEEFRGIPYGDITARWEHSTLRQKLPTDVFDASKNGPRCPQLHEPNNTRTYQSHLPFPSDVQESEFECLNLFVTRPSPEALLQTGLEGQIGNLPVYLYIHGGAYAFGAGTDPMWDPARLVAKSLALGKPFIAVHINYRLNILGFAASRDLLQTQGGFPRGCNFGLADQRIAIEWVSRNIAAFGGDPHNITIGGQSAGASSAHAHVLDQISSGGPSLLRRAIIQSAAVGTLGPQPLSDAENQWEYLCNHFGVSGSSCDERVTALRAAPVDEIIEVVRSAGWHVFPLVDDGLTITRGVDDQWRITLRALSGDCMDMGREAVGPSPLFDVLIGDTEVEASIFYDEVSRIKSFDDLHSIIQSSAAPKDAIDEIMRAYDLDAALALPELHTRVYMFLSDLQFGHPIELARQNLSKSNGRGEGKELQMNVYSYRVKFGNPFPGPQQGVAQHCVDLIYIYDCFHDDLRNACKSTQPSSHAGMGSNEDLVETMQSDWIRFIAGDESRGPHLRKDELVIYDSDRKVRVIDPALDIEYTQRKKRFETLEKHHSEAGRIAAALTSSRHPE